MKACRCGYIENQSHHPCHGQGYTCCKPSIMRWITYPTALAGQAMKLGAYQTWACDSCWEDFQKKLKDHSDGN